MNKTALFLILLIAPLALAQQDVLNMIDRTPEGKQLLDNLFIQTKLMGDNLDTATIRAFLKTNREKVEAEQTKTAALVQSRISDCNADEQKHADLLKAHTDRQFALKRHVESSIRTNKRVETFAERSAEELENYKKFETYIQEGVDAWKAYFKLASDNFKSLITLLRSAISATRASPKAASFVELSEEFHSNLAEMRVQIQSIDLEYTGMGPIVNNLLEIMADPNAAAKPEVRNSVRLLAESLVEYVKDRLEEVEEQHEHQVALFDNLVKTYHENSDRSQKEVTALNDSLKNLNDRLNTLKSAQEHAVALTNKVENIIALRAMECANYKNSNASATIRSQKASAIINQVEGILADRSAGLKTFFLQREMRQS